MSGEAENAVPETNKNKPNVDILKDVVPRDVSINSAATCKKQVNHAVLVISAHFRLQTKYSLVLHRTPQEAMVDIESNYPATVGYSFLIVSPVLLCFCFPAQTYIGRFQKELLAASFGTICGFTFFEVIPAIIKDAHSHILNGNVKLSPEQRNIKIWLLSCTIFGGMLFAALLGLLHEVMEHKHCEQTKDDTICSSSKTTPSSKLRFQCLSCM